MAAMIAVVVWGYWGWTLMMIALLMLMGPVHPPTANDDLPLGTGRTLLGWASLLFVLVGFHADAVRPLVVSRYTSGQSGRRGIVFAGLQALLQAGAN